MVEVSDGLFLGSEDDAAEVVYGKKCKNVTHILSIVRDLPSWLREAPVGDAVAKDDENVLDGSKDCLPSTGVEKPKRNFATLFIRANDSPKTDLLSHFDKTCTFIQQGVDSSGGVLVHCVYGISRSATIVLAYLMKREGRKLEVVMENVQKLKPDIKPNEGFVGQLKLWGGMRCRLDLSYKPYKMYRLQVHSINYSSNEADGISAEEEKISLAVDPGIQEVESQVYYRCRKCRRLLFTEDSVLQHELGDGLLAFHPHWQAHQDTHNNRPLPDDSCSSFFIEPVAWMEEVVSSGEVTGKVLCPKCSCKLGTYSWSGLQCSCGRWVTPSFQIHKSRVDDVRTLTKRKPAS